MYVKSYQTKLLQQNKPSKVFDIIQLIVLSLYNKRQFNKILILFNKMMRQRQKKYSTKGDEDNHEFRVNVLYGTPNVKVSDDCSKVLVEFKPLFEITKVLSQNIEDRGKTFLESAKIPQETQKIVRDAFLSIAKQMLQKIRRQKKIEEQKRKLQEQRRVDQERIRKQLEEKRKQQQEQKRMLEQKQKQQLQLKLKLEGEMKEKEERQKKQIEERQKKQKEDGQRREKEKRENVFLVKKPQQNTAIQNVFSKGNNQSTSNQQTNPQNFSLSSNGSNQQTIQNPPSNSSIFGPNSNNNISNQTSQNNNRNNIFIQNNSNQQGNNIFSNAPHNNNTNIGSNVFQSSNIFANRGSNLNNQVNNSSNNNSSNTNRPSILQTGQSAAQFLLGSQPVQTSIFGGPQAVNNNLNRRINNSNDFSRYSSRNNTKDKSKQRIFPK